MPIRFLVGLVGLGTCMLLGCGTGPADTSGTNGPAEATDSHAGHDHAAAGPHGGHLIVLGEEEYHAELTHDEASHTVAVYLLDGAAKEAVPVGPTEITLQVFKDGDFVDHVLKASADGGAYAVVDEPLCDLLLHAEVKGRVRAVIADQEYVGVLELAGHDHASGDDHDHDSEDAGHDQDGDSHGAEATTGHEGHDHE